MSYLYPKTDIEIYREHCENLVRNTTLLDEYETCRGDELEIVEDTHQSIMVDENEEEGKETS